MRTFSDLSGNGMGAAFVKQAYLEATLDAVEFTASVRVDGNFNASLQGTFVGTFKLERSLDNGVTFDPITALGEEISFTTEVNESFYEPEPQALYRWKCSAYTSGSATARIGK